MTFKTLSKVAVAASLSCAAMLASAAPTALTFDSTVPYLQEGDFQVYSASYLTMCAAAGDTRCTSPALTGLPIGSQPSNISGNLTILNGAGNVSNTGLATADQPYETSQASNNGSYAFPVGGAFGTSNVPTAADPKDQATVAKDPGATAAFAGNATGTWDVTLGSLVNYLGSNNLVFIFGNNAEGNAAAQYLFGTAQILTNTRQTVSGYETCYVLGTGYNTGSGCLTAATPAMPTASPPSAGNYLAIPNSICVDKDGQALPGLTQAQCTATVGYWTSNNIGQNSAEFFGYSQSLEDAIRALATAHPDYVLSLDIRMLGMSDGGEDMWICGACRIGTAEVPEPGTLLLLGGGLLAAGAARRRRA